MRFRNLHNFIINKEHTNLLINNRRHGYHINPVNRKKRNNSPLYDGLIRYYVNDKQICLITTSANAVSLSVFQTRNKDKDIHFTLNEEKKCILHYVRTFRSHMELYYEVYIYDFIANHNQTYVQNIEYTKWHKFDQRFRRYDFVCTYDKGQYKCNLAATHIIQ